MKRRRGFSRMIFKEKFQGFFKVDFKGRFSRRIFREDFSGFFEDFKGRFSRRILKNIQGEISRMFVNFFSLFICACISLVIYSFTSVFIVWFFNLFIRLFNLQLYLFIHSFIHFFVNSSNHKRFCCLTLSNITNSIIRY